MAEKQVDTEKSTIKTRGNRPPQPLGKKWGISVLVFATADADVRAREQTEVHGRKTGDTEMNTIKTRSNRAPRPLGKKWGISVLAFATADTDVRAR